MIYVLLPLWDTEEFMEELKANRHRPSSLAQLSICLVSALRNMASPGLCSLIWKMAGHDQEG